MKPALIGMVAWVPMMIGTPSPQEKSISASLCNGGSIAIPLREEGNRDLPDQCPMKGCHSGACRKKLI